ncbi:MAG: gluconate 2-dehydrogenase subunit 3 family protein [Hymenobacter sp.]
MNRRTAVKNLVITAGAISWLPACMTQTKGHKEASLPLKHLWVSAHQAELLAEVCETIIPRTATPGARDLGVHLYVLKMLDDCCQRREQLAFVAGLAELEQATLQQYKLPFLLCSPTQKLSILRAVDSQIVTPKQSSPIALLRFYGTAKRLTVAGYTNSKYFMTKQVVYELVPSRYDGYFPIKNVDLSKKHRGQS